MAKSVQEKNRMECNKKARAKYAKEKLKRIPLDVKNEYYDEIKAHADKMNESVNGFIKRAIAEAMVRDKEIM